MLVSSQSQRGFASTLILLGVLAVALFALGSYYVKKQSSPEQVEFRINSVSTPSKTQDKYINQDLGFELTLSGKDLQVKIDSEEEFNKRFAGGTVKEVSDIRKNFSGYVQYAPGSFLGAVAILGKDNNFDKSPLTIWVFENKEGLSAERWYNKYWYYPFIWGDFVSGSRNKVAPVNEATISGKSAKYGIVDYSPGSPKFIYITYGGKMFLFRVMDDSAKSADKILQTFKFLN